MPATKKPKDPYAVHSKTASKLAGQLRKQVEVLTSVDEAIRVRALDGVAFLEQTLFRLPESAKKGDAYCPVVFRTSQLSGLFSNVKGKKRPVVFRWNSERSDKDGANAGVVLEIIFPHPDHHAVMARIQMNAGIEVEGDSMRSAFNRFLVNKVAKSGAASSIMESILELEKNFPGSIHGSFGLPRP
jgi:hypothetical protein